MRAIIDTCVIVDALQGREPFCKDAESILLLCASNQIEGFVTAKAITDIYYLTHRSTHDDKSTRNVISKLISLLGLVDTTSEDIYYAISSNISDFEDAVMVEAAKRSKVDCIVTRNLKDYTKAKITIYSPEQFLEIFTKQHDSFEEEL